jgi:hypothetical protein
MKEKYPGLRISFVRGYRDLIEQNFFGTQGADLNTMSLIDRINMFYKGGPTLGIRFTEKERDFLKEVEAAETYDDILVLAKRISDFMREQKQEQKVSAQPDDDEEGDYESDGSESYDDEFSDDYESDQNSPNDGETDDVDDRGPNSQGSDNAPDDEIRSMTDDIYRQNENKLFSTDSRQFVYCDIPKYESDKAIVDHKDLWRFHREEDLHNPDAVTNYSKLLVDNNKVVSYLVKEFELRKNAEQLKRASTAKTGDLNMSKIFSYKFNEDIFKKITVMPGGKSHGLVMFLDWSGSMHGHILNTVKQLLSLVMFCKKVNIPYEVFAFANNGSNLKFKQYSPDSKKGEMVFLGFRLLNMLSSRMSASEFKYAASELVGMASNYRYIPNWMSMDSTPMYQAILSAMDFIPKFQKNYRLEIVNTIFLTDGESDRCRGVGVPSSTNKDIIVSSGYQTLITRQNGEYVDSRNINVVVTDPVTKHQESFRAYDERSGLTESLVKLLKARTGCNVLGFYVLSGREFTRNGDRFFPLASDFNAIKTKFRKDNSVVVTNGGFDEYYLLRSDGLDTDDDEEFDTTGKTTTRSLVTAFTKYTGKRHNNRVILNRFIGMIA